MRPPRSIPLNLNLNLDLNLNLNLNLPLLLILNFLLLFPSSGQTVIRINQLGYRPSGVKVAVLLSRDSATAISSFLVRDAITGRVAARLSSMVDCGAYAGFRRTFRLDFSGVTEPGGYLIEAAGTRSPEFRVNDDVYDGAADFLLTYMRQQRCGFNPFLNDSCHTHDGYVIYGGKDDSTFIDVVGGWHDAADYLQYVTTSATATAQMLLAYRMYPSAFGDAHDAAGRPRPNGIPDVLDEATWGLRWLLKMNPRPGEMYNQIADDRDHQGFRIPTLDSVDYGFGRGRPVYRCTGEPQGLSEYKNRSTGLASTAGKFASAFALGSLALKPIDLGLAETLASRARSAFATGVAHPGVCQTAPCRAPYFYEEDNWLDDIELAAASLQLLTGDTAYGSAARQYGRAEGVTRWMLDNTARHYQWYPFVNVGHYLLAAEGGSTARAFRDLMQAGIDEVYNRGKSNPFLFGIPFIWCSNNYVSSTLADLILHRTATGDRRYEEMEASLRDWLFGCNPWGTSMVIGLPKGGTSPRDPHSAFSHERGYPVDGGLVDGPVTREIFAALKGVHLSKPDPYAEFQSDMAVYHDDWADYSTNEPTMDGTAGLTLPLAALAAEGRKPGMDRQTLVLGGVVRMDTTAKTVYLFFSGHEFDDDSRTIRSALQKAGVKASFFFTGDFYQKPLHASLIRGLLKDGHYLGGHSDKHLLYADWRRRDSTLVSRERFFADLRANYEAMGKFRISPRDAWAFLPPYEWYNREVSDWCGQAGLTLVSFTPGTRTNADYTTPDMGSRYLSSGAILDSLLAFETAHTLNGAMLLMHVGTDPARTDRFARRVPELISELKRRGYRFDRLR
ncbi:MAG: glycoside hydrolase family 9 protein [Bacteroidota bacterium]